MNKTELDCKLNYLVKKYVYDDVLKCKLLSDIEGRPHPIAKYILSEVNKNGNPIESSDALLIKEISFYYL